MSTDDRIHELLPWYLTGTLRQEEASLFRDHLPGCEPCQAEMAVLKQLQSELERHGGVLLEDHPDAERLVAAARGEPGETDTVEVRRHIALCSACATETRWVTGEAIAGSDAPAPAPPSSMLGVGAWGWIAAAAAVIVLLISLPFRGTSESLTGVVKTGFVAANVRADDETQVFRLGPHDRAIQLFVEVDVPPDGFPVSVEILDGSGNQILRETGIGRDYLLEQLYLSVLCDRRDCAPGRYTARIRATGDAGPPIDSHFEVRQE